MARLREAAGFVRRALLDFGLRDEFESRPAWERAECLWWIAEANDSAEEEQRVSRLLSDLAEGRPLKSLSMPGS